jgi:hypothetical protein
MRHQDCRRPQQAAPRLSQRARWEYAFVRAPPFGAYQNNIGVAPSPAMLKSIVQYDAVGPLARSLRDPSDSIRITEYGRIWI